MFRIFDHGNPRQLPTVPVNSRLNDPSLYRPSEGLIQAVNVALNLNQPLLLTGEPGTGKTQLADHIAWFFDLGDPLKFDAQTTSTAKDLFYRYDALGHFQYSQAQTKRLRANEIEKKFIRYQALGQAIRENRKGVVLIDEIDKAPRDLPNDVLGALERLEFRVPELDNRLYKADPDNRPFIIMTSNSEKNLPDAFLRRVAYYHIPFPDTPQLLEILQLKTDKLGEGDLRPLVNYFESIRKGRKVKLKKNPATAELIGWAMLLQRLGFDFSALKDSGQLTEDQKVQLRLSFSVLAKNKEDLDALRKMA